MEEDWSWEQTGSLIVLDGPLFSQFGKNRQKGSNSTVLFSFSNWKIRSVQMFLLWK